MQTTDKNLQTLMTELTFIGRHVQTIDGTGADFDVMDEISMAVRSGIRALTEYRLSLQPACEEIPADVPEPDVKPEQLPTPTDTPDESPEEAPETVPLAA